jgi:transposase-like protein
MTSLHPAAKLPDSDRQNMAVQALAGGVPVSQLALQHGVSRKFVYQHKNRASAALDEVFASSEPDDEVLFELPVTKTWLRQLTLGLSLICHSSYRGVVELMRDLLGVRISEGTVHNIHQAATRQAGAINRGIDLSPIRVGLHDEIFQGSQPVLADAGQGLRGGQKAA